MKTVNAENRSKLCSVCGTDVARLPRTKDHQGYYFCQPCWIEQQSNASANRDAVEPVDSDDLEQLEAVTAQLGGDDVLAALASASSGNRQGGQRTKKRTSRVPAILCFLTIAVLGVVAVLVARSGHRDSGVSDPSESGSTATIPRPKVATDLVVHSSASSDAEQNRRETLAGIAFLKRIDGFFAACKKFQVACDDHTACAKTLGSFDDLKAEQLSYKRLLESLSQLTDTASHVQPAYDAIPEDLDSLRTLCGGVRAAGVEIDNAYDKHRSAILDMNNLRLAILTQAASEMDRSRIEHEYTSLISSLYAAAGVVVKTEPIIRSSLPTAPAPPTTPVIAGTKDETPADNRPDWADRSQTDPLIVITDSDETWFSSRTDGSIYKRGSNLLSKEQYGRNDVLLAHPLSPTQPAHIDFSAITTKTSGILFVEVCNVPGGGCNLAVICDGKEMGILPVGGDEWRSVSIPFDHNSVELQDRAKGWYREHALIVYKVRPPELDQTKIVFSQPHGTSVAANSGVAPESVDPFDPQIEKAVNDLAKSIDGFNACAAKIDKLTEACDAAQSRGDLNTSAGLIDQLVSLKERLVEWQQKAVTAQTKLETMDRHQVLTILANVLRLNPQMPAKTQQQLQHIRSSMAQE